MFKVFPGRAAIEHGFSAYDYDALGAEAVGEFMPELLGVAFGVFEYADLYQFARVETIGEAFEHVLAYAILADLSHGLDVGRYGFEFAPLF